MISTKYFKHLALICGLGAMGIVAGCGSNGGSASGTGGSSARGGSTGTGGASALGGATSATGGATSAGGASAGPVTLFSFDSSDDKWALNTYQATDPTTGAPVSPFNLAAPGVLSDGALDAGIAAPTLGADSTVGNPPGSLKVVATFTDYNQQVNPNFNWGSLALQDWTGKVVSVSIKVDPAVSTFAGGGVQLFAQDSNYTGLFQWTDFPTDNGWHTYTLDMTKTSSPAVNPAQIIQFTVQIASPGTPTTTDDGGVTPFTPTTVTAYIDTITVAPAPSL